MITSMLELLLDINRVMGVPTMLWDTKTVWFSQPASQPASNQEHTNYFLKEV
jgi:hypothetical protein